MNKLKGKQKIDSLNALKDRPGHAIGQNIFSFFADQDCFALRVAKSIASVKHRIFVLGTKPIVLTSAISLIIAILVPNAPSNLKASFTSLFNLQISWVLLSSDQANGIVHGYHYIVYDPQNEVIVNRTVSNTTHSVNVTNIKACTGYVAQVRASTGAGDGNYSTLNISNPCGKEKLFNK